MRCGSPGAGKRGLTQQGLPGPENVAGAHGEHHIPRLDDLTQVVGDLRQGLAIDGAGNFPHQIHRGDAGGVALPGGVNFRQHQHIRLFQLPDEVGKQRLGAGVGVGLEGQHQAAAGHAGPHGADGGRYFIGMVLRSRAA